MSKAELPSEKKWRIKADETMKYVCAIADGRRGGLWASFRMSRRCNGALVEVRMRFAMLFVMTIAVWLSSAAQASDKDIETWRYLSERCRMAIEQGERLDTQGLNDLGPSVWRVPPLIIEGLAEPARRGYEVRQHSWQQAGSSFVVVEREYLDGRRSCVIQLAPGVPDGTAVEEAGFVSAFLQKRQALIAAGTHEERNPDPIFSTNLGVGPIARSASGCRIISGLQIEARPGREPLFNSFSAEQAYCSPPR